MNDWGNGYKMSRDERRSEALRMALEAEKGNGHRRVLEAAKAFEVFLRPAPAKRSKAPAATEEAVSPHLVARAPFLL